MSPPSIGVTKVVLTRWTIVVGDLVALLLGEQDLAGEPRLVGPALEHLLEQPGGAQRVLAGLVEEVEEDAVARDERGQRHGREATSPRATSATRSAAWPSHISGGCGGIAAGRGAASSPGISAIRCGARPSSVLVPARTVTGRSVLSRSVKQGTPR